MYIVDKYETFEHGFGTYIFMYVTESFSDVVVKLYRGFWCEQILERELHVQVYEGVKL